jgi:NAD-dependent DNA ligase
MNIVYTNHAEYKMEQLKIHRAWIEEAIKYPDELRRDNIKYYAIKKLNGISIEVVYIKTKYIKVITLYRV